MEFLADLGLLALGSRMKALSDRLYGIADEVYRLRGCPVQGRWFPLLRLLHDKGPQTVGAIAAAIGQTHSAVSQLADKLVREDWLTVVPGESDRRCRYLALTDKARDAIREARPAWRALIEELGERCASADVDILQALARFEGVLDEGLAGRVAERCSATDAAQVRIEGFQPALREHFYRLNADWLRKYFYLEEIDHRVLSQPETEILAGGGEIFFALIGETVVGTCALLQESAGTFELTKMAVDERYQGRGIGRKLLAAAIAAFQKRGGKTLFLESSTRLKPALALYESMGFVHQPALKPDSHYSRSDVYMIWQAPAAPRRRRRAADRMADGA
ncbi:bifunctional helix-turn-helix transcriptional regulator/GNAT family N-acetyltransferase [Tahibacter amnicola]|uniref:Bifunctional helix-turn-helix transcriptional regulator/GNAT family N-acetyltransferase n=1 Tax=Tahibacter amnicola TaxID=2976241 RepID=A0ABY6BHH6_9GAMM|nr:bifunctional helix-turn-helix transcriptional regulator/GNAT family N-acetyltransferase [Tahibacter amnicola]UXI68962.1 bifunctional helix-turn-helix transcriptional regulator/GNAT family N-acetyltransferase [Tahibacter amnicola]